MMAWLKKWWQRLRRRPTTEIKRVAWYTGRRAPTPPPAPSGRSIGVARARRAKKKRQVRRG